MIIAIYPGTFDPITNGHLDIIKRTRNLFDKLVIVINDNINKKTLFSVEERKALIEELVKEYNNVEVLVTSKLTVNFAEEIGASVIVRGLRMVSDFEYELQMSTFNHILDNKIETIFVMADHNYSYLSSSSVKEIAKFKGDVSLFVPENVKEALIKKYE